LLKPIENQDWETLKWIAYVSANGLLLVAMGSVSAVFHLRLLHLDYISSYFHGANSFTLITVIIFLYVYLAGHKKI
jgi:hypothetical protein